LIVVTDQRLSDTTEEHPSRLAEIVVKSPLLVAAPFVAGWVVGRDIVRARRMRARGTDVLPISLAAAEDLRFPPGHARNNVLYVGHPVDRGSYLPAAEFHRFLFEHKVAEALQLIRSLGATKVTVRSVKGWNREAALSMGMSLPDPVAGQDAKPGGVVGHSASSSNEIVTTMTLRPTSPPAVPTGLVWMPHEPIWQEIANARLESGLHEFSLDVRSTDDFGVNASLKALVDKVGFDAGGRFVHHVETIWRLDGVFES
jgi:hypothetical protein